jgi:SAM-dependent methyltransferase
MAKHSALALVEGFYAAHAVFSLHRQGVLDALTTYRTPAAVAIDFGYDIETITAVLEFLHQTTEIVVRNNRGKYRLALKYKPYRALGFHLDKFLGAYGEPVVRLEESLRLNGRALVDRGRLKEAFFRAETRGDRGLAGIIRESGIRSLLDLGSGTAALLCELGQADADFRGWAIDADPAMCAAATGRVAAAGLEKRIRVICIDVRRLGTNLRPRERLQVEGLFGRSLLNEFFRSEGTEAVRFLGQLKRLFPGRRLFVADYYGKLTHCTAVPSRYRHTLLQDLVQALTVQGVPPPDLAKWTDLYLAAGCEIIQAFEGESDGLEWFLHVVQL